MMMKAWVGNTHGISLYGRSGCRDKGDCWERKIKTTKRAWVELWGLYNTTTHCFPPASCLR